MLCGADRWGINASPVILLAKSRSFVKSLGDAMKAV
jgi:hypothetical protein